MSFSATILGCGSSAGVPRVAQGWGACDPSNPRNRRRRCALLVSREGVAGSTEVVVDLGPDIREQLLDARVMHIDAILLTHAHADHIHGIDDVRPYVIEHGRLLPVYMDAPTSAGVREKFGYIFRTPEGSQYPPLLREHGLTPGRKVVLDGPGGPVDALPILFRHGDIDALGFRFGDLAYTPDVSDIPPESAKLLEGLDVWIIDALRYRRHPSHLTVAEALSWIERLKPRRAILTNLHTDLDYATLERELPLNVIPAFDGLRIEL
ncbi:MAG: MBL fold metallo-hydrolase [Methylobacteriaceae bacterium]|nr:MBL fold metallo-hydrolase [Methylobacteriaceae bacterium]MCC0001743.1 MBL fold metallo-hydrolase [Methylobacteriaceae bacterium]MCO5089304.1 MBL fold metallo-hydrolase [Methylobacteriaceae bacterium]HPG03393.1 MBL fold metallo-hydrolase [Rhodoblastus sp.]